MEVFKILGRIAVSNEDANEKIEETGDKAEKTSKKMSSVFGNIGKFALKAAKGSRCCDNSYGHWNSWHYC